MSSSVNTGIEIIDSQHEFLDRMIDKLIDILTKRDKSTYVASDILDEIIDYYKIHFFTENIFLNKIKEKVLVDVELHKKEHQLFLEKLENLKSENLITVDLLMSLKDWSKNHINDEDFRYYTSSLA